MIRKRLRGALLAATILASAAGMAMITAPPAHAFFGGGFSGIVYDPTNHAENLLTAARAGADQQSDRTASKRSADADQSGAPAAFLAG